MNKIKMIALALAISPIAAMANQPLYTVDQCNKTIAVMAEAIMASRQYGVSLAETMAIAKGEPIFEKMVMQAYGQQAYHSKEFKDRAVADFRDIYHLQCLKLAGK